MKNFPVFLVLALCIAVVLSFLSGTEARACDKCYKPEIQVNENPALVGVNTPRESETPLPSEAQLERDFAVLAFDLKVISYFAPNPFLGHSVSNVGGVEVRVNRGSASGGWCPLFG